MLKKAFPVLVVLIVMFLPVLARADHQVGYISVQDLKSQLDRGANIAIIDVRSRTDYLASDELITGAMRLAKLDAETREMLTTTDVVLYSDTNDARSMKAALILIHKGFYRVKVLKGGLSAWKFYGFPLDTK